MTILSDDFIDEAIVRHARATPYVFARYIETEVAKRCHGDKADRVRTLLALIDEREAALQKAEARIAELSQPREETMGGDVSLTETRKLMVRVVRDHRTPAGTFFVDVQMRWPLSVFRSEPSSVIDEATHELSAQLWKCVPGAAGPQ